jgi:hypothetical protein
MTSRPVPTPELEDAGPGPRLALAALAGSASLLALIQALVIALGLLGIELTQRLAAVVLAIALLGSVVFTSGFLRGAGPRRRAERSVPLRGSDRVAAAARYGLGFAALGWAAWIWAQLFRIAAAREPIDWDGLWYHIPAIHEWSRRGGVAFIDALPDVPFVNVPMGVELTSFFVHRLLNTSRLVDAGNLWYWPLAVSGLAVLAIRLGARGPWPWAAGALFAACPAVLALSATVYVDPGLAAAVVAALAAGAVVAFDPAAPPWRTAVLLGLTLGLALGAKGTGSPFAAVVGFATAIGLAWAGGSREWRRRLPRLLAAGGLAVLVGGYWYARNLVVTGNPLYPYQFAIGANVILPGWDYSQFKELAVPEWMVSLPAWARAPLAWYRGDALNQDYVFSAAGLGRVWAIGGIPGAAYCWIVARRKSTVRIRELTFLTVAALALLLSSPVPWRSRLTIWLLGLGLPAMGAAVSHAARAASRLLGVSALTAAAAAVALAVGESHRVLALERARTPAADLAGDGPALDLHFPGLSANPGFAAVLQAGRVARGRWTTEHGTLLGGLLALPLGAREVVVIPPKSAGYADPWREATSRSAPAPADLAALRAAGIEWVIWDSPRPEELPGILIEAARERYLYRHPSGSQVFHIVRLRP